MTEMGDRLRQARVAAGFTSARKAATKFGWRVSTYGAHENGQNKFDDEVARNYAAKFKVTAGWLLAGDGAGPGDEPEGSTVNLATDGMNLAPVAGIVEAGLFREAEDFHDFQHEPLAVPRDDRFPHARQVVFIAQGKSMNAAKPTPILPGSRLVCVDYEDIEMPARDGWKVIIERERDGGLVREWSVKEVELTADVIHFHPRSTEARFKTITVPLNPDPNDDRTVRILALVRQIFAQEPL